MRIPKSLMGLIWFWASAVVAQPVISADQLPGAAPSNSPPTLPPLSQEFQAAMANSQLQTYRYGQLTEQAIALKKLCETGFGPSDLCPSAGAKSVDAISTSEAADLPTIAEINGTHGDLSAVLMLADGRRVNVRVGTVLPSGLRIIAITTDDVRVAKGGERGTTLYFGGRMGSR